MSWPVNESMQTVSLHAVGTTPSEEQMCRQDVASHRKTWMSGSPSSFSSGRRILLDTVTVLQNGSEMVLDHVSKASVESGGCLGPRLSHVARFLFLPMYCGLSADFDRLSLLGPAAGGVHLSGRPERALNPRDYEVHKPHAHHHKWNSRRYLVDGEIGHVHANQQSCATRQ